MFGDKKEELSILVYISTSKISASFVSFAKSGSPKVLYSAFSSFSSALKLDDFTLEGTISTLLNTTLTNLISGASSSLTLKNRIKNIDSVSATFSAPWFISKVKDLHLEQEQPFLISDEFIENILQVEEKAFEKELSSIEEETIRNGLSVIENTFTHSKVNGYSIPNNIGKKTKNFDISLYTSFIGKNIVKEVIGQIQKHTHLGVDRIHLNTFPLVFFYAMRSMFSSSNSFLFMNVEGEVTDLTLVHDGGIKYNISFPSARNFVIRQIAKKFDVSPEIADSMLHMYNSEKMDNEVTEKMKMALMDVEREWSIYFEDSLVQISKTSALPAVLYIVAESDIAVLYNQFLKMSKTDTTAILRKNLNIVHINSDSFSNFCTFDLSCKKDEYIAMMSVFHNRIKLGNY